MSAKKQRLTSDQLEKIRLFETLFEGSQTLFGFKDRQHRYLYVNNEMAQLIGRPLKKIIGLRPDNFLLHTSARIVYRHQEEIMATGRAACFVDQIGIGSRVFACVTVYFPLKNALGIVTSVGFISVYVQDLAWLNAGMQDMLEKAQETIFDLQKQVDDMRMQATTDPLTGVWNRVQAEVIGRQEMVRQERSNTQVSIIFVDPDHFKNIHNAWGRNIGDIVLVEFCQVVNSCLRATDVLARWGGEVFVIILPDTGLESATSVAERTRLEVEAHHFEHIQLLTASFGVATYFPGETWHYWVERADAALYRARNKGRNRIELDRMEPGDGLLAEVAQSSGFLRLVWRRSYESGHPVVDQQHRQLFAHANNLLSTLLADKPEESINILIDGMITAVEEHFRDEEQIIREAGYPESEGYARIHSRISSKAQQLSKRYHNGNLSLDALFSFLTYDVVAMHILVNDKHFFPYVSNMPAGIAHLPSGEKALLPSAGPAASRTKKSAGTAKTAKTRKTVASQKGEKAASRKRAKKVPPA